MEALTALLTRSSIGGLSEPAPDADALDAAFRAALRAPDHRMLRPWRYLTIRGEGRQALGEAYLAAGLHDNPDMGETERNRLLAMPLRAPLIVAAIMSPRVDDKVPEYEQMLSMGAAIENFLLALHAKGYAGMWRTGWMAEHPMVKAALGLQSGEMISGYLYCGSAVSPVRAAVPLNVDDFVQPWPAS
ncbi:MAG TPA: nitroreductase [Fluviicoccus sp.]|nr:nitroreductase [Fluviicoccus sp.]